MLRLPLAAWCFVSRAAPQLAAGHHKVSTSYPPRKPSGSSPQTAGSLIHPAVQTITVASQQRLLRPVQQHKTAGCLAETVSSMHVGNRFTMTPLCSPPPACCCCWPVRQVWKEESEGVLGVRGPGMRQSRCRDIPNDWRQQQSLAQAMLACRRPDHHSHSPGADIVCCAGLKEPRSRSCCWLYCLFAADRLLQHAGGAPLGLPCCLSARPR